MKFKIVLLSIGLLAFTMVNATQDPAPPCNNKAKKDDLAGFVLHSESKKPLKDVSVTAYLVSKKEKAVVTDEEGVYGFEELKPGTYKFVFEKAGYKKVTKEKVVVKADEAFQLNIEMMENKAIEILPSPLHFTDF